MRLFGQHYTRSQLLERVGTVQQVGGTRRCRLEDGRATGTAAIEVDTGAGLRFTVLPDRGLDILQATFRGTNLAYLTPNGGAHPAFFEPQGMGWLRTFFAGLLTTCGLTYLGNPGKTATPTSDCMAAPPTPPRARCATAPAGTATSIASS